MGNPLLNCIAILRGINVSGQKKVEMAGLRGLAESLGCLGVQSYIQSGNLVFASEAASTEIIAASLRQAIATEFGFEVAVLVRTAAELRKIVTANPYLDKKEVEPARLHVTFLAQAPDEGRIAALHAVETGPDCLQAVGREIFLHCPNGYGKTKFSNVYLEKILAVQATTRNWKSVNKLLEMAEDTAY